MNAMLRVLTFRFTRHDIEDFKTTHLVIGLFFTCLVGMGRYWDNPKAELLQTLGVGSII